MDDIDSDAVFDRAPVYIDDDGAIVYRASSLGRCVGALTRARLGVSPSPPPDAMQTKFDEGHDWEERVLLAGLGVDWTRLDARKLKKYGRLVEDIAGTQVETEIRWGKGEGDGGTGVKVIRCHPDAIAVSGSRSKRIYGVETGNNERRVVEAKFFGPDLFWESVKGVNAAEKEHGAEMQARGLGFNYALQLAIEMHSTGLPALYVIGLKATAQQVDVEQGRAEAEGELMLGEVWTMEVDTPPYTLAEIKARVLEVEGYAARGTMPDCPKPLDYPCPYWQEHEHWDERVEVDDDILRRMLDTYDTFVKEREAKAERIEALRGEILDRVKEMNRGDKVVCAGFDIDITKPRPGNVSWAKAYKALSLKTKERVDEDKFRGETVAEGIKIGRPKNG